jgi:uncharacterized iron-regulated protein
MRQGRVTKKVKTFAHALMLLLIFQVSACRTTAGPGYGDSPSLTDSHANRTANSVVLDLRTPSSLIDILPDLAESRAVYVGERHDSYAHHLKQLEIIRKLYSEHSELAIGMEQFQQPFQGILDDYIAGTLSEKEMLRKTEWYDRWRFDFRLYRPILAFARENRIPVIALNVPSEIKKKVSTKGVEGLSADERSRIPAQMDDSDPAYRARLREVFDQHPGDREFERFLEVQLLWDEGMAARVAEYLQQHPGRNMVVLAGTGHLVYGQGIPNRVTRRISEPSRILLPAEVVNAELGIADYLLFTGEETLPVSGKLGVMLEDSEKGVKIAAVVPGGAAEQAGVEEGDRILKLDDSPVKRAADVRIELLDRSPGDRVRLTLQRKELILLKETLSLEVELKP